MKQELSQETLQRRIFRVRGCQVLLDVDLADLYGVSTSRLNRAVKRNQERFPLDFMFELSRHEIMRICQIGTSSPRYEKIKFSKRVSVFTEQGIAMLSGVLRSPRAVQVNIAIMRAFVRLRHAILTSRDVARRVEKLEGKVHVCETDIRLILDDVRQVKKRFLPEDPISPSIL